MNTSQRKVEGVKNFYYTVKRDYHEAGKVMGIRVFKITGGEPLFLTGDEFVPYGLSTGMGLEETVCAVIATRGYRYRRFPSSFIVPDGATLELHPKCANAGRRLHRDLQPEELAVERLHFKDGKPYNYPEWLLHKRQLRLWKV